MIDHLVHNAQRKRHERAIAALIEETEIAPEEVRVLYLREFARLERNAKIRTHLQTLTICRVRSILRQAHGQAQL